MNLIETAVGVAFCQRQYEKYQSLQKQIQAFQGIKEENRTKRNDDVEL